MHHNHGKYVPHTHFSPGVFYALKKPELTWGDIGGYQDVKEILKEMVCLPLLKPDLMSKLNVEAPAGVLLWGPLGVGMKMLTEAAATEAKATYVQVSGQEMLGKPNELKKAFADALKNTPSVLYISDIDWLVPRAGADYAWEKGNIRGKPPTFAGKDLTTVLIKEIDHLQAAHKNVALISSCYRIDVVDQVVIKEKSRFNRKVFVHPPVVEDRKEMLKLYLAKLGNHLDSDINIEVLAKKTEGFVGWDIETLCKRAALNAIKDEQSKVSQKHFLKGVKEVEPWLNSQMTEMYYELKKNDCPHHYFF